MLIAYIEKRVAIFLFSESYDGSSPVLIKNRLGIKHMVYITHSCLETLWNVVV